VSDVHYRRPTIQRATSTLRVLGKDLVELWFCQHHIVLTVVNIWCQRLKICDVGGLLKICGEDWWFLQGILFSYVIRKLNSAQHRIQLGYNKYI
jgi:hypothetical protein